jgi:arylsulfatase A-like enzyme
VPVKPARRHEALFPELKAPRTASFNEADVSDKPDWIHYDPLLSEEEIAKMDLEYRLRVQAMQAVDEMIAELITVLKETGQLDNTYVIFTSDNGYHFGQHRLPAGKATPYEEDIRVPFIVRGPGIEPGSTLKGYLTGNVDFAPTIAELAGVVPPVYVDGRSMVGLLNGERPAAGAWRSAYLLEFYGYNQGDEEQDVPAPNPEYLGLRTNEYLYVEYQGGFIELYDLLADPFEMENIAATADKTVVARLSAQLKALSACTGRQCRELDLTIIE